MTRPPEISQVADRLSELGFWVCQIRDGLPAGAPQILACLDGQLMAVFVKRSGFGPSRPERRQLEELEAAGAVVRVVSSVEELTPSHPLHIGEQNQETHK
jgi:hypothetical protein